MRSIIWLALGACIVQSACGGGSQWADLEAQATAAQIKARHLGVDMPCSTGAQCATLHFGPTTPGCPRLGPGGRMAEDTYKVYSLASDTAAQARKAADRQNDLAARARSLQPPFDGFCLAIVPYLPAPVCSANRCVVPAEP